MPSGAKKRKAAKKKKEQQESSNYGISINGNNHGNGGKKPEDERSSDSSEVNSPVSDGNPHQTFGERNGVPVKSSSSLNEPVAAENKLTVAEEVVTGEAARSNNAVHQNDTVKIKEDFKSAQDVKSLEEAHITSASELKETEDVEVVVSSRAVDADKTLTASGVTDTSINQNVPTTATSINADVTKDNQFPESPENQPLVASAPRLAQRTSWLSCCGLFGD
ncbi:hypothetical protein LINGRAHAP2_LOCUS26565 [Linum grandiflorum]